MIVGMANGNLDLAPVEHIAMFFAAVVSAVVLVGPFIVGAIDCYFRRHKTKAQLTKPDQWPFFVKTSQGASAMMILFHAFLGSLGLPAVLIPLALIVQAVRSRF